MKCEKCGKELTTEKFCSNCGTPVSIEAVQEMSENVSKEIGKDDLVGLGSNLFKIGFVLTILFLPIGMLASYKTFSSITGFVLISVQLLFVILGLIFLFKKGKEKSKSNVLSYISIMLFVIGTMLYFTKCYFYNIYIVALIIAAFLAFISVIRNQNKLSIVACILAIVFIVTAEVLLFNSLAKKGLEDKIAAQEAKQQINDFVEGCRSIG